MAKKSAKKNNFKNLNSSKEKVDKEMKKSGLTYTSVLGGIVVIIGILLVIFNLTGVLEAFIGLVLLYFGFKLLGFNF